MLSHMNNKEEELNQRRSEMGFESNSQSSMSSHSQSQQSRSQSQSALDANILKNSSGEKATISLLKQPQSLLKQPIPIKPQTPPKNEPEQKEKLIMKVKIPNPMKVDFDIDEESNESSDQADQHLTCDICQGQFKSSNELRQHIKSHIHEKGPEPTIVSQPDQNEDELEDNDDDDFEEDFEENEENEMKNEKMGKSKHSRREAKETNILHYFDDFRLRRGIRRGSR